jgi:hypothetical protein
LQHRLQFASQIATFIEYGVIDRATTPMLAVSTRQGTIMKLCGQISIELTVDDFVEAADHQKRLESLLKLIKDSYPDATLAMRERRQRKALSLTRATPRSEVVLGRYGEA